jgi:hypothetical protein
MKKNFIAALLLLATFNLFAQNEGGYKKNDLFITGGLSFQLNESKVGSITTSSSSFAFSPAIGYFVSDNISIAGGLSVSNEPFEIEGEFFDATSMAVQLSARYYMSPSKKFSPFGHFGFGFGSINPEGPGSDLTSVNIGVSPGINYFLNNHFSVEAGFGRLGYTSVKSGSDFSSSNFGLNLNMSTLNFALNYKF